MQASRVVRRFLLPALAVALAAVVLLLSPGTKSAEAQDAVNKPVGDVIFGLVGVPLEFDICANDVVVEEDNYPRRVTGGFDRGGEATELTWGSLSEHCTVRGTPTRARTSILVYKYNGNQATATVTIRIIDRNGEDTVVEQLQELVGGNKNPFSPRKLTMPADLVPDGDEVVVLESNCSADGVLDGQASAHVKSNFGSRVTYFEPGPHCFSDPIDPNDGWTLIGLAETDESQNLTRAIIRPTNGSTVESFISGTANNVTVQNLIVTNFEGGRNVGAINAKYGASGWHIIDNEIHSNIGVGVNVSTKGLVRGNEIHSNAQIGISGFGYLSSDRSRAGLEEVLIENNAVYNNANDLTKIYPDYRYNHHEGGIKVTKTENLTIRSNAVFENEGIGLFCDLFCNDVDVFHNVFAENVATDPLIEDSARPGELDMERAAAELTRLLQEDNATIAAGGGVLKLGLARIQPRSAGGIFIEISEEIDIQDNIVVSTVPEIDSYEPSNLFVDPQDAEDIPKKVVRSWQDDGRAKFSGGITIAESKRVNVLDNYIRITGPAGATETLSSSISVRNHSHLNAPGSIGAVPEGETCWKRSRGELGFLPDRISIAGNTVESDVSSFIGQPKINAQTYLSAWRDYHGRNQSDGAQLIFKDAGGNEFSTPVCQDKWANVIEIPSAEPEPDAYVPPAGRSRATNLMCHQAILGDVTFTDNTFPMNIPTAWYGIPSPTTNHVKWSFVNEIELPSNRPSGEYPIQGWFRDPSEGLADGVITIEAEDFDFGGNGVAFSDDDRAEGTAQVGPGTNELVNQFVEDRTGAEIKRVVEECSGDRDAVDIYQMKSDNVFVSDKYVVGRTAGGEWLEYTIDAGSAGRDFDISLRLASGTDEAGGVAVSVDGDPVGSIARVANNGWWNFTDVKIASVQLEAGTHVVRVTWTGNGKINFDKLLLAEPTCHAVETQQEAELGVVKGKMLLVATGDDGRAVVSGETSNSNQALTDNYVEYCLEAPSAGSYTATAMVRAEDNRNNSFFFVLGDGQDFSPTEDAAHFATTTGGGYELRDVRQGGIRTFQFEEGPNTLRIYHREAETFIDWFKFTAN